MELHKALDNILKISPNQLTGFYITRKSLHNSYWGIVNCHEKPPETSNGKYSIPKRDGRVNVETWKCSLMGV